MLLLLDICLVADDASADCFKSNSSLITDMQESVTKLVLSPIDDLASNSICYGMRDHSSAAVLIIYNATTLTTQELHSK